LAAANRTRRNENVGYNVTGSGNITLQFHFVTDSANLGSGKPLPLGKGRTRNNTGTDSLQSVSENWLGIVIDSTHPADNNTFAQLNLTDLYLAPTGKWLSGKIEAQDTLLVAYGKNDNPNWVTQTIAPRTPGQDTRNTPPPGPGGVAQKPYWTWETHSAAGPHIATAQKLAAVGYGNSSGLQDNDGAPWVIDKDSAWYIVADTSSAGGVLTPFTGTVGDFMRNADGTISCADGADYNLLYIITTRDSTPNNWLLNTASAAGRQPVSVRRGNSYWTYTPKGDQDGRNTHAFYNNADGSDYQHISGAPILFLTLLPGDANFVRWNVGFGGYDKVGNKNALDIDVNGFFDQGKIGKGSLEGKLIPTPRRPNASGHYMTDTIGGGVNTAGTPFRGAHTVTDTVTRYYNLASTWCWEPDTLFIFDADSNISLDSTKSPVILAGDAGAYDNSVSGTGAPLAMSGCWNAFGVRKYDTIVEPGRRVYNWGYDRSGDQNIDRVRKIRLVGFLPGQTNLGQADTLNSAFAQATDYDGTDEVPAFSANKLPGLGENDAIWITAGPIANMTIEWQKSGSSQWLSFPGELTSSEAKTGGHKIRATLTDRCNNIVSEGTVGFQAFGTDTYMDTVALTVKTEHNQYAGLWVHGLGPTAGKKQYSVPTIGGDTMFLYARAVTNYVDDKGQVQGTFATTCQNDEIYFAFTAYNDSTSSVGGIVTSPNNKALVKLGGSGDQSYKIKITGSTTIASLMMSNSKNGYIRSAGGGWPVADTASAAASSACATDIVTFKIQAIDDCGHLLPFNDSSAALVTFESPVWVKGGWNTVASWKRKIPVLSDPDDPTSECVYKEGAGTGTYYGSTLVNGVPNPQATNFWGLTFDQAKGYGSTSNITTIATGQGTASSPFVDAGSRQDTIGAWVGAPYVGDDKNLYRAYKPGNTSKDTVSIKVRARTFTDETILATISTEPSNFRFYKRKETNTGRFKGDTTFVASRGDVEDTTKTTYAYGVLRDCNNELVSDAYNQYTKVYWRLEGTSRWSAFLFNPEHAYNVQSTPDATWLNTGTLIDSVKAYRGTRQLVLGINGANGRAYVGINSDTVGGQNDGVGKHVFPIERDNIFPSGTYVADRDSLNRMYAWGGKEAWNQVRGLEVGSMSGREIAIDTVIANKAPTFTAVPAALQNNLRGYNELAVDVYYYNPDNNEAVKKLNVTKDDATGTNASSFARYRVLADKVNQIAFVDGTGDYFDEPINSQDHQLAGLSFLNLYGRQAAEIINMVGLPEVITERRVIRADENDNKISEGADEQVIWTGKNSWKGGRSYAGRVVPLYIRIYDMFGNPLTPIADSIIVIKGSNNAHIVDSIVYQTLDGGYISNQFFTNLPRRYNTGNTILNNDASIVKPTYPPGISDPDADSLKLLYAHATDIKDRHTRGEGAVAAMKSIYNYGKLRGTLRVDYQTLSHSGAGTIGSNIGRSSSGTNTAGNATNGGLIVDNPSDDQAIIARYVTRSGATKQDKAYIASKPTGELAAYNMSTQNITTGRVGTGNVIDWVASDIVEGTYPESAKLVWYDFRYSYLPKVLIAADNKTGAPLLDLYGSMLDSSFVVNGDTVVGAISVFPTNTQLNGFAQIARVTSLTNGVTGWADATNDVTYLTVKSDTNNPTKFGDFVAMEYSDPTISRNNTGYLGGPQTRPGQTTNIYGFFGGVGRIKVVSRKAGNVAFTIVDSVSYNNAAAQTVIVGDPARLAVLPGGIHWVTMTNPNAVNINNEAVYPYPIRRNYRGTINFYHDFIDGDTLNVDPYNKNWVGTKNPRSYAVPIDTIFVGHTYNMEVRNYDRYGNRNTIDSIYVSVSHIPGGFWKDSWASNSEYLLQQDTSKYKTEAEVMDLFQTIATEENYASIPEGGGFHHQLMISYKAKGTDSHNGGVYIQPDLLERSGTPGVNFPDPATSMIVAFREVYVKRLEKPGTFDIVDYDKEATLIRLDDGNYNLSWTPAKSTNTSDDGIEYNIRFYDGLTGEETGKPVNVPYIPETRNDIQKASVPPDSLAKSLGLPGPQNSYNRNVKVVVEAKNKWGVTTNATHPLYADFELNKTPEKFALIANGLSDGATKHVNEAPFELKWNIPLDFNGIKDGTSATSYNKQFNLDTIKYQIVLEYKGGKIPEDGIVDSLVAVPWVNTNTSSSATITKDFLVKALGGIDKGDYSVYVVAKDRSPWNYDSVWTDTTCTTKSTAFSVTFIKSGAFAKMLVDDENKAGQTAKVLNVGEDHEFSLIAADADGNKIRAFGGSENPQNLKIFALGVDGSKYTGTQKLTLTVDGKPLAGDVTNGFILPSTLFVEGEAKITYNNTKSGKIHINVPNTNPVYKTIGEGEGEENNLLAIVGTDTRDFITKAGAMEKLSVEVMPRQPGAGTAVVFVNRMMEVIVSPADFHNNPIDSVEPSQSMLVRLSPRYPEEFQNGNFGSTRVITGRTEYILTPNKVRDDQWFVAIANENLPNQIISSQSNPFRIVAHAPAWTNPNTPPLTTPSNGQEVVLQNHGQRQQFAWQKATDPNNTPLISDVSGVNYNDVDVVKYTLRIEENSSYIMADSIDTDEVLWATGATLYNLTVLLGAGQQDKVCPVHWYVVASDGLYETKTPSSLVNLKPSGIVPVAPVEEVPVAFALGQNYPNPFNPTTNIQYDIPKASDVKIVIYNILGQPVRTLVNERKEAAKHNVVWDGKNDQGITVATGTYIYQIHAGEFSATKKMNLLK